MAQLTIEIPESLLEKLHKQADVCHKTVQEIVIENLETLPEISSEQDKKELTGRERIEEFIRESGLFASSENKLGPELGKMIRYISPEERD